MANRISYFSRAILGVSITASSTTTQEITFVRAGGPGYIFVPSGSNLTSLTFYGAPWTLTDDEGVGQSTGYTYLALYGPDLLYGIAVGSALSITVAAGKAYPIPSVLFGCRGVKIVGNTTGTIDLCYNG
jgi:hypothetical protein